jgi:hypothetical protein
MIVRLVNPTYDARRRRTGTKQNGGEGGFPFMAHHKHHYHHRRRNPFAAGSINQLAVKVAGALGGAIAASSVPSMISPGLSTGWAGVGMALVVAFGGAWLLKGMSMNLSEGVLIGGSVQAVSRAVTIVTGKTLLTASLGQYGPLNFTIPTPAYSPSAPAIAASASKTTGGKAAATPAQAAAMGMLGPRRAYSKYVS